MFLMKTPFIVHVFSFCFDKNIFLIENLFFNYYQKGKLHEFSTILFLSFLFTFLFSTSFFYTCHYYWSKNCQN
jgi:hypothetical protein